MNSSPTRKSATAPPVRVRNLQRKIRLNVPALEQFATRAFAACARLKRQPQSGPDGIFVMLTSDERMSDLHQHYLNQCGPTDVITFQHGEIFVSVPTARRQARQFGTSTVAELRLYIVHGLLHLAGLDDRTSRQRARMRAAESAVLRAAGV